MAAYKRFVDFHGELLLLLHWSLLAYTGLVKILKKHLKRTGLPVRAPQLENLLSQPFCSVEVRGCPGAVSRPRWIKLCLFEPCRGVAGAAQPCHTTYVGGWPGCSAVSQHFRAAALLTSCMCVTSSISSLRVATSYFCNLRCSPVHCDAD